MIISDFFSDKISADISKLFFVETATYMSYSNFLFRRASGTSVLTLPTPCQIECLFASDCHFVILVVNSDCAIGNFKKPMVSMGLVNQRIASIFMGSTF
jgi:hypothetical protein